MFDIALSIYSKSPSAYHAQKSLGILNLPCNKTLKGYMDHNPGVNEQALLNRAQKYELFRQERVINGFVRPVGEGVLMWDEVQVCV